MKSYQSSWQKSTIYPVNLKEMFSETAVWMNSTLNELQFVKIILKQCCPELNEWVPIKSTQWSETIPALASSSAFIKESSDSAHLYYHHHSEAMSKSVR